MLTQEEAANSIGISLSLLQKMEQGIRSGNDATKIKVASFYGKTVGYLFLMMKSLNVITQRKRR